jgi:hypothetical protein
MHRPSAPAPSAPTIIPDPPLYTVLLFCRVHFLSRSKLYELWDEGQGPAVVRVGRRRYITGKAAQAWRQKLEDDAAREAKP